MVSTAQTETVAAMSATDKQLAVAISRLEELKLMRGGNDEADAEKASAVGQIEDERAALAVSRELLEGLLAKIRSEVDNAQRGQDRVTSRFGSHNKGFQLGVSNAPISGITFGKRA